MNAIIQCGIEVHRHLGPGLLETIYEKALCYELRQSGFQCRNQVIVPVIYKDQDFDEGFKADIVVNDEILLELKCVEHMLPVHRAQLLSYMRLMECDTGLLFKSSILKDGIARMKN